MKTKLISMAVAMALSQGRATVVNLTATVEVV
jgi:hypothetical protein